MNDEAHPGNPSWGIYDGVSDVEKWEAISGGHTITKTVPGDVSFVIASGPHWIGKNRFIELGFALVAGEDSASLVGHTISAKKLWMELDLVDNFETNLPLNAPYHFELEQNYPNPFNSATTISYQLPKQSFVRLDIYSLSGRHIYTLVKESKTAGMYSVVWDGKDKNNRIVSTGMYYYQLSAGNFKMVRKLLLIK
jgi:hypothetical protein